MVATRHFVLGVALGGLGVGGLGYAIRWRIQKRMAVEPYFTEAQDIIRNNKPARELLGDPIKLSKVDPGNSVNVIRALRRYLEVPYQGKGQQGDLFLWAVNEQPGVERTKKFTEYTIPELECADDVRWTLRYYQWLKRTFTWKPDPVLEEAVKGKEWRVVRLEASVKRLDKKVLIYTDGKEL